MDSHNLFPGIEWPLVYYNGKSVYAQVFQFFAEDGTTDYSFDDFSTIKLDVYTKRDGRLLKTFDSTYLSRSGNDVTFNAGASAMEFDDLGKYYYEMYYVQAGGYEVTLLYGEFKVI